MKKIISLLLVLCLCIGLCACSEAEKKEDKKKEPNPVLLPEGLAFGMSFEEVKAWDKEEDSIDCEMELENGSTPGSYVAHMWYWDMIGFYGFDTDNEPYPLYGHAMFSFNSDREMYEFYGGGTVKEEGDAEKVQNRIVDYYESQMDKQAMWTEDGDSLIATLKNDSAVVEVQMYPSNGEYGILVVIHNYEYEVK